MYSSDKICKHKSILLPYKDEDIKGLSESEVRARFPRFCGECPDCNETVIQYSSMLHYVAGDW